MIRTVLVVPLRDNVGHPFAPETWRELRERLLIFGGYTRTAGATGEWTSGAAVYRDRSYQFIVALASWKEIPTWLDVVRWAQTAFRQEAMYIEVAGTPEIVSW